MNYNVDIAMCIDATGSMGRLINTVKKNTLSFYMDLTGAMEAKGKHIDELRASVIAFRNYIADGERAIQRHYVQRLSCTHFAAQFRVNHPLLEGKQQTRHPIMLEGIGFLESDSLFEDAFIGKNLVDSIQPFLRIAAAALEDEALLIAHPAKLLFGNLLNTHSFISPIVIDCS